MAIHVWIDYRLHTYDSAKKIPVWDIVQVVREYE